MNEGLDFVVDKITNSIEEVATGKTFATEVLLMTKKEIRKILKKDGWDFNWKEEFDKHGREVYKLVRRGSKVIEGLISIERVLHERYIEMHLIESAPSNRGNKKAFRGVAPNLVAFVCKESFDMGFNGTVAFLAKTSLIDHFIKKLGAQQIFGRQRMAIFEPAAKKLVNSYYENFKKP